MPAIKVIFYKEDDNSVPTLEWLDTIPPKAQDKCFAKMAEIEGWCHMVQPPKKCDFLYHFLL